ncbi:(E2-independent) E3 ubiquitin-conjugating enzyme FATS [Genypterus blacodes]|uniref:(E2-independent) E3 ubiquitin-conjugating enzyme FATS n=1 Tax=Genypterus blacodes TaxID=154954 RepID=UPI003F75A939
MDPNYGQVTVQRRATIVKVTEHRMTSNPSQYAKRTENSPVHHGSDTVVHRRNATIIKVTEHRESYSPAKTEYRRSYTDGGYRQNGICTQGKLERTPSHDHLASSGTAKSPGSPNTSDSVVPDNNEGTLHRSTLSLILGNPPPTEPVGQRSQRPSRPMSCYGNVFGHTESGERESETRPNARKRSFELPRDTEINLVNPGGGSIRSGTASKEASQTLKPNRDETERETLPRDTARRMSPCLTLIKAPDPSSQQSAEEVLALNAAAIIANIKLQRQLSKKKTPNGNSEKDSVEPPQGNSDVRKCTQPDPDQTPVQQQVRPHADSVPPGVDLSSSAKSVSLQEALQRCRPDFISRSQDRVRELEQRAQERRGGKLSHSPDPQSDAAPRQKRDPGARLTSLRDNLFKPRDKAITGKEMQHRSRRNLAEVKQKTDEEQKRKVCLSNRQRAELFKKKLLDQVLHRSNN